MPDVFDTIENAPQRLRGRLSVTTVYGDPVTADGITVIPVSKVSFAFGGGGGSGVSAETLAGNGDAAIRAGLRTGGMGGGVESDSRWQPRRVCRHGGYAGPSGGTSISFAVKSVSRALDEATRCTNTWPVTSRSCSSGGVWKRSTSVRPSSGRWSNGPEG